MTVNVEALKTWTAELRSGNRVQATGTLEVVENGVKEQCCLGVACDIFADTLGLHVEKIEGWRVDAVVTSYDDETGVLPNSVRDYLGLEDSNPLIELPLTPEQREQAIFDGKPIHTGIANLNDGGMSFEQIADVIDYFLGGTNA